ncbi:MAG: DUF433 domain-containing protein [bacterium]|nr:DUF433 domain-containing protein [bacterium]
MRRHEGVMICDGPTGRHAVIVGTGLDVWEVIATWKSCSEDFEQLRQSYDWLTEPQLRSALGYYQLHPREIEDRLARERSWTRDRVRQELALAGTSRGSTST